MKKILTLLLFVAFVDAHAQTPSPETHPGAGSMNLAVPPVYTGSVINSVWSWEVTKPLQTEGDVVNSSRTVQEVKKMGQYLDGLGRLIQTVNKAISPAGFDVVSMNTYDPLNREPIKYLPYTATGTQTNGSFKFSSFADQALFMASVYGPAADDEKFYYSRTDYETSPLNRIVKNYAPGNNWVGDGVGVGIQYFVNIKSENIQLWTIDATIGDLPNTSITSVYESGQLYKTVTTDERGKQVVEYKDKEGHVVLKKVQLSDNPSATTPAGWLCTYYVYDDLDNLRFVIPPMAVDYLFSHNWTFDGSTWATSPVAKELCFSYEYDGRHRVIVKRVPGASDVFMVYDARDRLVMVQDKNLRNLDKWLVTVYDNDLNRPVQTGLLTDGNTRAYHQNNADTKTDYPHINNNFEQLTQTFYDNYDWVALNNNPVSNTLTTTNINSTAYFYTPTNDAAPYPQPVLANYNVRGMVTGTKTKVLETTSNYLWSVNFYDDRGRSIQKQSSNFSGGKETSTSQYSFNGQVLRIYTQQNRINGGTIYKVGIKNEYDGAGRLLKTYQKTGASAEILLAENAYDELGQLKQKKLGQQRNFDNTTYSTTPLDILNYEYNIRGWLRGVNKDYARGGNIQSWFGMELCYDYGFYNHELNGNIAGIRWRNGTDGEQRAYGFTYDNASRLKTANFTQYTSNVWNTNAGVNYSLPNVSYDLNGNIIALQQWAAKLNTSGLTDDLTYNYSYNGNAFTNKLNYVKDARNDPQTTLGDFKEQPGGQANTNAVPDYDYDTNGNLIFDKNKDISAITYNYLNLPVVITITGKGVIAYTYSASGEKLQKLTDEPATGNNNNTHTVTTTFYMGAFTYLQTDVKQGANATVTTGPSLQFVTTLEGRVRPSATSGTGWAYDYMEKDHLGNVRVLLTDELKTDVYPVLSFEGTSTSQEVTNQNITWDNSAGNSIDVVNVRSSRPTGMGDATSNGSKVLLVKKSTGSIGATKLLKVMAGDQLNISVDYYYTVTNSLSSNANGLGAFINSIAGIILGSTVANNAIKNGSGIIATNQNTDQNVLNFFFTENGGSQGQNNPPKAYLHVLLFDERFVFDAANSFVQRVGYFPGQVKTIVKALMPVKKSGYAYIYFSNESDDNVYFDNLNLTHVRGRLLETTDYTPWGLTMAGIGSKALNFGDPENKHLFDKGTELQNKEFSDGSGLELYSTQFRSLDPQIGRWWQIDPKPDMALSPYVAMNNNPISINDPLGDTTNPTYNNITPGGAPAGSAWNNTKKETTTTGTPPSTPLLLAKRQNYYYQQTTTSINAINTGKISRLMGAPIFVSAVKEKQISINGSISKDGKTLTETSTVKTTTVNLGETAQIQSAKSESVTTVNTYSISKTGQGILVPVGQSMSTPVVDNNPDLSPTLTNRVERAEIMNTEARSQSIKNNTKQNRQIEESANKTIENP